jgi:GNAT superfamily N-acetyltransferase
MKYVIFDFLRDFMMIDSFLESASIAHKQSIKSKKWFLWKFRDNPFGESILACAITDNKVVGCVALGMQDFLYEGDIVKGAISFETFVHPNFQGRGIFKKLIELAEKEACKRGIKFLLNFPNSNSLKGFQNSGWNNINCSEYWIKWNYFFKFLFNMKELRKSFSPNPANFKKLLENKDLSFKIFYDSNLSFTSFINDRYLDWRFYEYPNAEYEIVNNENLFSIVRIGYRGTLKEIQVLFVGMKSPKRVSISNLIDEYKKQTTFDIISFPISKQNKIRNKLIQLLFIRVPNKTNVTYKIIDKNSRIDFNKLELSAINYHTY